MPTKKHILVCCLNWGLGHATRCIPLIQNLVNEYEVSIASSGLAGDLLQRNFPELTFHSLPDYGIVYGNKAFTFSLATQIPKVLIAIKKERKKIRELHQSEKFDIIISDSRLGCWLPKIKTIYLCHQLNIQNIPFGKTVNYLHQLVTKKFTETWVPDIASKSNLTGQLSKSNKKKIKYIGWLSQFENSPKKHAQNHSKILAIVSGPEPHRSIFENRLIALQKHIPITIIGGNNVKNNTENYIALANNELLSKHIHNADLIISRAGYTTIMDVLCLNKKAILIPTPKQTEQEYLAKWNRDLEGIFFISENQLTKEFISSIHSIEEQPAFIFKSPNWVKLLADL